uniref:Uncharacterized protein n=1 Tax=Rhizophora mucronata TaxID=61149 RepID=A0A2P2PMS2_RHIMU
MYCHCEMDCCHITLLLVFFLFLTFPRSNFFVGKRHLFSINLISESAIVICSKKNMLKLAGCLAQVSS